MDNNSITFMRFSLHFPSQLSILKKSPSQMKIDEKHLFEEQLAGCSSLNHTVLFSDSKY